MKLIFFFVNFTDFWLSEPQDEFRFGDEYEEDVNPCEEQIREISPKMMTTIENEIKRTVIQKIETHKCQYVRKM